MRWELKIFWGNDSCLGQSKTLPRSRWLTGADISDTWHEILGAHVLLLFCQEDNFCGLNRKKITIAY